MRIVLPILLLLFVLSGCNEKTYEPISKNQSFISTVNIKDMTVSFVNTKTNSIITTWELEKPYTGGLLLANQDQILLYGKELETADVYSLSEGKLIASWDTGRGIVNAVLLHNHQNVAMSDQEQNTIRFFHLNGEESKEIPLNQDSLTLIEGEQYLYAVSFSNQEVSVIDVDGKTVLFRFPIHPSAAGALLRENREELWIGGHGEGTDVESDIHVYHLKDGSLLKTIHAPEMPINFAAWNDHVYVLSHGSNMLYQLNSEGEKIYSIQIGANPFDMTITNGEIVVAGYDSNDLTFIDPKDLDIKQKVKVGSGPFRMIVRENE